ncbi:MAG: hypothetical protein ACI8PZ_005802 [Myxococcota bacterium]|jgi:hypothetical protein
MFVLPRAPGAVLAGLVLVAACDPSDNDGYTRAQGDCSPQRSAVHPGALDLAGDDIDQDCDGTDGRDADSDGFASVESGGADCDDNDPLLFPGAKEISFDGVDQDCNGADQAEEVFIWGPPGKVDLLLAVDRDSEGDWAVDDLEAEVIPRLLGRLQAIDTDWRIGVLTMDDWDVEHAGRLLQSSDGVFMVTASDDDPQSMLEDLLDERDRPYGRVLSAARSVISQAHERNPFFFREDAPLVSLVYTHTDDASVWPGVQEFADWYAALRPAASLFVWSPEWEGVTTWYGPYTGAYDIKCVSDRGAHSYEELALALPGMQSWSSCAPSWDSEVEAVLDPLTGPTRVLRLSQRPNAQTVATWRVKPDGGSRQRLKESSYDPESGEVTILLDDIEFGTQIIVTFDPVAPPEEE